MRMIWGSLLLFSALIAGAVGDEIIPLEFSQSKEVALSADKGQQIFSLTVPKGTFEVVVRTDAVNTTLSGSIDGGSLDVSVNKDGTDYTHYDWRYGPTHVVVLSQKSLEESTTWYVRATGQQKLRIVAEKHDCPLQCASAGTCTTSNHTCHCDQGHYSGTCAVGLVAFPLASGTFRAQTLNAYTRANYYTIIIQKRFAYVSIESEDQLDLYVKKITGDKVAYPDSFPKPNGDDFRSEMYNQLRMENYAKGSYMVAVMSDIFSPKYNISLVQYDCAQNCSAQGSCDVNTGKCSCRTGFAGPACGLDEDKLMHNKTKSGVLEQFSDHIFEFEIEKSNDQLKLHRPEVKIDVKLFREEDSFWKSFANVFVRKGSIPTLESYDFATRRDTKSNEIWIPSDKLSSKDVWYVMLSSEEWSRQLYNITVSYVGVCPMDCSAHGHCNDKTFTCVCNNGWAGVACDVPTSDCSCKGSNAAAAIISLLLGGGIGAGALWYWKKRQAGAGAAPALGYASLGH